MGSRCWTCRRDTREQARVSAIVLRSHLDKTYPGAMVASLSVPWGHTGNQRGGYHLVWPRDLVECAGALLALGADAEARDTLRYLIATQNEDGHWSQNQWLGGTPYWQGLQLDETALPVLLATALDERDALRGIEVEDMVRRALGYIARTGPSSGQDRWEENEGINAFTLAVCIAALVAGAAAAAGTGMRLGAGARRFLERADRSLDDGQRHRAGPAIRCSGLLRPRRAARHRDRGRRQHRDRADPQPSRRRRPARRPADRHRIPAARAVRAAPRRRPADPRIAQARRCAAAYRHADGSGMAPLSAATAMASMRTAAPSTVPASDAAGRC